jgi:Zn-dependent metalloprotease
MHCLVPSYVYERIALEGTERQRVWALRSLLRDETLRTVRIQNGQTRAGSPRDGGDALTRLALSSGGRLIQNAHNRPTVIGTPVRWEGQTQPRPGVKWDDATDEAYEGLGDTRDFYADVFDRNSIDDEGLPLVGVIHYSRDYGNAFWDGRRMVFGDGDDEIFSRLTQSIDVIGHELTHGVTEDEAALQYIGQPGALNESISDVFGSLVKQYTKDEEASEANWLIGEDVWTPDIDGDALRSLKAPGTAYDDSLVGTDDQPAKMSDYVYTLQDNGGVHINSGIPNHAFYLLAVNLGGYAWERAGRIWYETLRHPALRPLADFRSFAGLTIEVAQDLYGDESDEAEAVRECWQEVEVLPSS